MRRKGPSSTPPEPVQMPVAGITAGVTGETLPIWRKNAATAMKVIDRRDIKVNHMSNHAGAVEQAVIPKPAPSRPRQ